MALAALLGKDAPGLSASTVVRLKEVWQQEFAALRGINEYLDLAEHRDDKNGALFRPIRNNRTGILDEAMTGGGI